MKAPALRPGDRIHLWAPSYPARPEAVDQAAGLLQRAGFRVSRSKNLHARHGYLAGTDGGRLAELHAALANPEVRAIFAVRGGYGAIRLLDGIDWGLLRERPRVLVGYSDFTALLLAAYRHAGLVSFHGPLAAVELAGDDAGFALEGLLRALRPEPMGAVALADARPLRMGRGRGPLLGGCLSLLAHLCGTGYLPDLEGAVLFWEEVGEDPYRIDRMLTQLRLGGHLSRLAGMLVGTLVDCEPDAGKPSLDLVTILREVLEGTDYPVLVGLPVGHRPRSLTLPVGVQALVEADGELCAVTIEEAATI